MRSTDPDASSEKWNPGKLPFDSYLIQLGRWEQPVAEKLLAWSEERDADRKKNQVPELLSYMIHHLLGNDCSAYGKDTVSKLAQQLNRFEAFDVTVMGFETKFYRDHLEHALRVMIMAKALVAKAKIDLGQDGENHLALASIFHDLCYPITVGARFFSCFTSLFSDFYKSLKFQSILIPYDHQMLIETLSLLSRTGLDYAFIRPYLDKPNHGIVSAMEFLAYVKEEARTKYIPVVQAIALHDEDINQSISFSKSPVLGLLTLCDAMQDWDRGQGLHSSAPVKHFYASPKLVHIELDYSQLPTDFLPMKQLHGKWKSLRRLSFLRNFPELILSFELPKYEMVDVAPLQRLIRKIFSCADTIERIKKRSVKLFLSQDESMVPYEEYWSDQPKFKPPESRTFYDIAPIADKIGSTLRLKVSETELDTAILTLRYGAYNSVWEWLHQSRAIGRLRPILSSDWPKWDDFVLFVNKSRSELLLTPKEVTVLERLEFQRNQEEQIIMSIGDKVNQRRGVLVPILREDIMIRALGLACAIVLYSDCVGSFPEIGSLVEQSLRNMIKVINLNNEETEALRRISSILPSVYSATSIYIFSEGCSAKEH